MNRMNPVKVMLADDNTKLLQLLKDYLDKNADINVVACVSDGAEVTRSVYEYAPDVLVMDMIMPHKDGFMVLDELSRTEEGRRTKVIALTGLSRDDFIMRAMRLGASYYMVKPFDMGALCSRILEFAGPSDEPVLSAEAAAAASADEQITSLFLTIGIPAHIKGYQYLREAVSMVLEDRDVINRITKELYPGIARKFGTSASKVERAMRHAIEVAWTRGRLDTVNQMYGYKVFRKDEKPTNGELVSCVSELIRSPVKIG